MELTDPGHWKTTDRQLAMALATAGCRFAPQEEQGPTQNLYTPEFLRSRGLLPLNQVHTRDYEAAVKVAVTRKIPGQVTYLFIQDDVFRRALAAWDAMAEEFATADKEGREPTIPHISEETAMQVLYVRRMVEKKSEHFPFINSPLMASANSKTTEAEISGKPAPKSITTGSGKIWSMNLNQQARKELKIG